ncbi:chemotaxis protein CheW [Haloarchaeobius sp. TZWWS8]|uniref:chemotaxis protein CheW n=1 Tax=Haloarchaeobius sp. TZWWS8 TaxID=3446121 RepID=UPI003EB9C9D8
MSADLPDELLDVEVEEPTGDGRRGTQPGQREGGEPEETERFVVFRVGEQSLAVSVDAVKGIVKMKEQTRVPRASPAVDGIMDLRGEITAVIDARAHFYTTADETPVERQRVVVFDRATDKQPVGVRVDHVIGVELFPLRTIVPSEHTEADAADHPLVTAIIHREDDGEVTEQIGLLDIKGFLAASGQGPE